MYQLLANGIATGWRYDPLMRRLCALESASVNGGAVGGHSNGCRTPRASSDFATSNGGANALQAVGYGYNAVGNILAIDNQIAAPTTPMQGAVQAVPSLQTYEYDPLDRLTLAQGWTTDRKKLERYTLSFGYDGIHNITKKIQSHWLEISNKRHDQKKTSYDWGYQYASGSAAKPHAPVHIGDRAYRYDANGNQQGWTSDLNGTKALLIWDDENRLVSHAEGGGVDIDRDNGKTQHYTYDESGERVIKRGMQGETVYVNQWFTVRNGEIGSKHVYAGKVRIATQMVMGQGAGTRALSATHSANDPSPGLAVGLTGDVPPGILQGMGLANRSAMANLKSGNVRHNPWLQMLAAGSANVNFLYFYHPDHLGSTGLVTDSAGKPYEHIQYFASGETWVQDATNTQRTPYLFTGKELDEETGLYYFGARYYDPRTSVWQSADPILSRYLPALKGQQLAKLPGGGGVYDSKNLAMYTYAHASPVVAKDPDGKHAIWAHKKILQTALQGRYAVSDYALNALKAGTEKADTCSTCQGNRASQTNLHGMAGFITGEDGKQRVQTRAEAIQGTELAIDSKITQAASLATKGKYDEALEALAIATHAAQDADQHGYEAWTFSGILNAFFSDPVGAILHWAHDNWLGGEEKARNAKITQGVVDKFREKAGGDAADKTLNYNGEQDATD